MIQYQSYLPLIEIFEDENFRQHIIHTDIIYFDLHIKDAIISVLEDKLISYIYDDEKHMIIFYSLNHLTETISRFVESDNLEIDFKYIIDHIYIKIKPLFDNYNIAYLNDSKQIVKNIDLTYQDDYCFEHKTVWFKYLNDRENMLWSFNDDSSETEYKIWFSCESLIINDNYYLSLMDICSQFIILNSRSGNIKWNQLKFFLDGPQYNIIIYLDKDEPYEYLILDDIIRIFEKKSVYKFHVRVGYSAIAYSPIIYTYRIGYDDLNY